MVTFTRSAAALMPVAAALVIAGCANSPSPVDAPSGGNSPTVVPSALPDVVLVTCDANGTSIGTPLARPQPDGVHVRIDITTGQDMGIVVGDLGGDNASAGSSEIVWPIPPGDTTLACTDQDGDRRGQGTVTIDDPDGIWRDPSVGCSGTIAVGTADYVEGAKGEPGDLVDVARARVADRLEQGDIVEAAGYPEAIERHVIVVRDGVTIAGLTYTRDEAGTGWLDETDTTCEGSNG